MELEVKERKKKIHDLYLAKDTNDFLNRLKNYDIDLLSLIDQVVDPKFTKGIVLGGSIPEGTGTNVSDVDILILLNTTDALGELTMSIGDIPLKWLHPNINFTSNWVVFFINGIEVNFEFKIHPEINSKTNLAEKNRSEVLNENIDHLRFLARMANGWDLYNKDFISLWKSYYEIDQLKNRRILSEFTLATKELEDMQEAIGKATGLVSILGSYVVTKLMRSLLAYDGYYAPSVKWLRRVDNLIQNSDSELTILFQQGRDLLFPGINTNQEDQLAYFKAVLLYTQSVELFLSKEIEEISILLKWFKNSFDTVNI